MAKRKTKKEDAGSTYGARGQEDQLWGAGEEHRAGLDGTIVIETCLGQSTQEEKH